MRRNKRIDRRKFVRRDCKVKTVLRAELCEQGGAHKELELAVVDISEGGLRIQTDFTFPSGEFNLGVEMSQLQPGFPGKLILPCEVAWKRNVTGATWIFGLEFLASQETCEVFKNFLVQLTQKNRETQPV